MNSVSPVTANNLVVASYSSGEIYVLSASDGKEVWSDSLSSGKQTQASALLGGIGGDPVLDNEVVVSVSSGGMIAVKSLRTGQRAWERPIGALNTPWVTAESLFVLTSDNTLVSFVKFNGAIRWSTKLASYVDEDDKTSPITWKGPVMVEGKLAVVSSNGQLLLVDAAEGKVVATKSIPDDIYTAPVVAGNTLYLVRQDATLYSLQ
jgi:outer membrane protein assembly factor BamB